MKPLPDGHFGSHLRAPESRAQEVEDVGSQRAIRARLQRNVPEPPLLVASIRRVTFEVKQVPVLGDRDRAFAAKPRAIASGRGKPALASTAGLESIHIFSGDVKCRCPVTRMNG